MDLHTGLRGVLHSDLHHGGAGGGRCTDNAWLSEALKFNSFFVLTNPTHNTAQGQITGVISQRVKFIVSSVVKMEPMGRREDGLVLGGGGGVNSSL